MLIVVIGLLNFHIPHFLLESYTYSGYASYLLEAVLFANAVGAVVAAVAIFRNLRWGWLLGIVIALVSVLLYVAQETVGLPGLPKMWLEPSRIVASVGEAFFLVLARHQLGVKTTPS